MAILPSIVRPGLTHEIMLATGPMCHTVHLSTNLTTELLTDVVAERLNQCPPPKSDQGFPTLAVNGMGITQPITASYHFLDGQVTIHRRISNATLMEIWRH